MLYATTRNKNDTYTAQRALRENRAPDGGLYIPVQIPSYDHDQILELKNLPAGEIIARVMNQFFACRINRWDVEFAIGKNIFNLVSMSHRITVGELWRNADGEFSRITRILTERIAVEKEDCVPGQWMRVATRIAVLFALFAELMRKDLAAPEEPVDIAVPTGDFCWPLAAWYGRAMGLPIGTIVCCCNENGTAWDLLRRGQMKTDGPVIKSNTPGYDFALPDGLEALICLTLGWEESARYQAACEKGGIYEISEEQHDLLSRGMYASVSSSKRLLADISNAYRTHGYVFCPYSALVYAGLMDYRATAGEGNGALIVCERSPLHSQELVARTMGTTVEQLRKWLSVV